MRRALRSSCLLAFLALALSPSLMVMAEDAASPDRYAAKEAEAMDLTNTANDYAMKGFAQLNAKDGARDVAGGCADLVKAKQKLDQAEAVVDELIALAADDPAKQKMYKELRIAGQSAVDNAASAIKERCTGG